MSPDAANAESLPAAPAAAARAIHERGYTTLEGLYTADEIAFFRDAVARAWTELGSPRTWARPPLEPKAGVEISVVGMVFHQLAKHLPELATRFLKPELVQVARAVLGDDMHLEYTAAIVNDGDRPYFPWHAHMGGVDNLKYRKQAIFPRFSTSERLTVLVYLDALTDESGTLRVHPRPIDRPTEPPFDPKLETWDGQVELRCRPGDVVVMDQCVWHAAGAKRSPGRRSYLACYFTSKQAPPTSWVDDSLRPWAAADPLIASVLMPPA